MLRNRLLFFTAWILSVIGISFFGGVISYGIFWLLTLIPFIMLIYLLFVLFGFKIYQQLGTKDVVSRAPVSYYFTLQNESFFAFSNIKVSYFEFGVDYGDLNKDTAYEIMPHSGYKKTADIICRYRGEYSIGIEKIIITDFFNLFKLTYKNPEPLKVNVLPAIEYPDDTRIETESLFSNSVSPNSPSVKDLLVRKYQEGDSIRRINWKATAKNQTLMVSNMVSEEHNSVRIILDTKRIGSTIEEYLPLEDKLLTELITLVYYLVSRHVNVELYYYSQGDQQIALNSMSGFDDFYVRISSVIFDSDNGFPDFSNAQNDVIIISNLSEKLTRSAWGEKEDPV